MLESANEHADPRASSVDVAQAQPGLQHRCHRRARAAVLGGDRVRPRRAGDGPGRAADGAHRLVADAGAQPAPLPAARPTPAPPPLVTVPVPEVPILREAPPEAIRVAAAPARTGGPARGAGAGRRARRAAGAARHPPVPPSALRYLVEPPVAVPLASRRLRETGTVVLRVVVDVRGNPRSVTLRRSSGFPRLDEQALGAMRQARFAPCTDEGRPVECESDAPIVYELEN
ncbi:MAG: energy transducer TonB [Comamonadaceae bacterium]|nr:energy transducer TonB [Comamonadaceae bacterium]